MYAQKLKSKVCFVCSVAIMSNLNFTHKGCRTPVLIEFASNDTRKKKRQKIVE